MTDLFDPIQLGELALPNRVVMAPMTRNRAVGTRPASATRSTTRSARAPA